MEIVDYGTTDSGIDFYVVKNSWGIEWDEDATLESEETQTRLLWLDQ